VKWPQKFVNHVRDSPEVNVFRGIVHDAEKNITANICLDMLQMFAFLEKGRGEGGGGKVLFLLNGASPIHGQELRSHPKLSFSNRWNGRGEQMPWVPQSSIFAQLNSLCVWRFLKTPLLR
jgi:hypothetical protein